MGRLIIPALPSTQVPYMGRQEIERMRYLIDLERSAMFDSLFASQGLVVRLAPPNTLSNEWKCTFSGLNVTIQAGKAFVKDGSGLFRSLISTSSKVVAAPGASATYDVLLEYIESNLEAGTVQVANGSQSVVGTGTEFLKTMRASGSLIIGSNYYPILAVADNTHLTLVDPYPGANDSGLEFSAGGFFNPAPSTVAERKIYAYDYFNIIIQSSAISITGTQLRLAQVVVAGGVITTLTDKRGENLFSLNNTNFLDNRSGRILTATGEQTIVFSPPFPATFDATKGDYNINAWGELEGGGRTDVRVTQQIPGQMKLLPDTDGLTIRWTATRYTH